MDYRKLFQVLVVGGAVVGGTAGCSGKQAEAAERPGNNTQGTPDAGAPADAGSGATGGGVQGW